MQSRLGARSSAFGLTTREPTLRGFTLIEVLVVIAVIALLIGILLPSLGGARAEARAIRCAAQLRSVGVAVTQYTINENYFPPSYVYSSEDDPDSWVEQDQFGSGSPTGYIHWSWSLFSGGGAQEEGFTCPQLPRGGAPRSNPGTNTEDWEDGQENDNGSPAPAPDPVDRQARRMAFTGNAAIFPRNKFIPDSPSGRRNILVKPVLVETTARGGANTILATEFAEKKEWRSVFSAGNPNLSKSHRPVTPFVGGGGGTDVYSEPTGSGTPRYFYPGETRIRDNASMGAGLIDDTGSTLNAVGRHHPGAKSEKFGGTANFVFVDGHVERDNIMDTIKEFRWGERFFSLSGNNKVNLDRFLD